MLFNKLFPILIFFILDFIHITFASKKGSGFILQDTEYNIGRDVEPIEAQEQQAPQTEGQVAKQFTELIGNEDHNDTTKLGDEMNKKDFFEHLCSAMTTIGQYENLFRCLTDNDVIPDFLVHGNETLVEKTIVEFPTHQSEHYIHPEDINKAMIVCLDEDRHERVFNLLENVRTRFVEVDQIHGTEELDSNLNTFYFDFFVDYFCGRSYISLKRFITFHGEELQMKYPVTFLVFFTMLLRVLTYCILDPDLRQFYNDLLGQSSPSMLNLPAEGFLPGAISAFLPQPLITCEWREAVMEGLKGKSPNTGKDLWNVIMAKYPGEFPIEFPPSDTTRTAVLKKFKSRQELEDDWARKNILILLEKLEIIASNLPTVLWNLVFGYATITWVTTLSWDTGNTNEIIEIEDDSTLGRDPHLRQAIHKQEQFKELIDQGKYDEIVKLGDGMESSEFLKCLCPSMTTLDHLRGLFRYLESRKMLLAFLVHGNTMLVDEAIIEFGNPNSNFYIYGMLLIKAIIFFLERCIYDRLIDILKATRARCAKLCLGMEQSKEKTLFKEFMFSWSIFYPPDENSFPIKHFLTLHGEDFATKYPDIFGIFCESLVSRLGIRLPYPKAVTLLSDLVGQRSLLTPTIFAQGFLSGGGDKARFDFVNWGWKEAIEEGLKQDCPDGGEQLWAVMVDIFPEKFNGAYPNTDELRAIACAGIKSKEQIEDEWIKKNVPKLFKHFEDVNAFLPKAAMKIIYEYLIFTWIFTWIIS